MYNRQPLKTKLITGGIILAVLAYLLILSKNNNDFNIYVQASADLFKGIDIYTALYKQSYHYYYSVFFAILIYPLTLIPYYWALFIWLVTNAFFFYRIIRILAEYFDLTLFSGKQKALFFFLCFIFGLEFIVGNFTCGQATICILYLSLEGIRFVFSGRKILGALLIALGINIKIMPIVLLPYLLYRREFKAAGFVVIFYILLLGFPGLLIGVDHNNALLTSWWHSINPMNPEHILDEDETSFHGLSTFLSTLLVERTPTQYDLPIKRNIANLTLAQLTVVLNVVRFMLISFSLYFLRTKPFVTIKNKMHRIWELSYLLLLVPLIFPHQQVYAFLFVTPATSYIIYYLFTQKGNASKIKYNTLLTVLSLSYLACNISFLLGQFNAYYVHFKVLTYGALLIIPMLAVCVPQLKEPD